MWKCGGKRSKKANEGNAPPPISSLFLFNSRAEAAEQPKTEKGEKEGDKIICRPTSTER